MHDARFSGLHPASRAKATKLTLLLMTFLSTPALAQYVPQSSAGAPNGAAPFKASPQAPRPNPPLDIPNLATLGAKLDGSPGDQTTIQGIYDALPAGFIVQVPQGSVWNGTLTKPDPSKTETWIFNGTRKQDDQLLVGDGDLTISYNNSSLFAGKKLVNTKQFTNPGYFLLWNMDSNLTGPYSGNWQQYTSSYNRAISGPTSKGNTGAIYGKMDSYGQNPSSAYDVTGMFETNRYGQNSTWGFVNQHYDFTGRPPQAFSNWMEEGDIKANGYDWVPWDPKYYNAAIAGGRVGFYLSFNAMDLLSAPPSNSTSWAWAPGRQVHPFDASTGGTTSASVVKVRASDSHSYTWFCTTGGTTGAVQPTWPAPARFVGAITGNRLEVTSILVGSLAAGDYLSASGFIVPLKILGQIKGETGGPGSYILNVSIPGGGPVTGGMFAAPQVSDNTAIWSFGTTFELGASHAFYLTGDADVATGIGGSSAISNAVLDTSGFRLDPGAAAIRLAPGQSIDLTSEASLASNPAPSSINQHTLQYSTQTGNGALRYQVGGASVLTVDDAGSLTASSIQLPKNNPINFTKGETHTLQYSPYVGKGALAYIAGTAVPFTLDDAGNATLTGHITTPLATPTSSSAPCKVGEQKADANYVYVCVATNTWKRAALSSF